MQTVLIKRKPGPPNIGRKSHSLYVTDFEWRRLRWFLLQLRKKK